MSNCYLRMEEDPAHVQSDVPDTKSDCASLDLNSVPATHDRIPDEEIDEILEELTQE